MADIFISYKREDRDRVEPFAHALEHEGFSVWWDADLLIGSSYASSIKSQLNEARAVIPVWTNLSVQSEWVQEEATQGKRRGVLFPIRFDNVDPPIGFTMVETADLSSWRADDRHHPEWSRLLEQLRARVTSASPAPTSGRSVETVPPRVPRQVLPSVERKPGGNRLGFAIGGGAIVLAVFVGSFLMQRGRSAGAGDNAAAAATPSSTPAAAAATATSGSSSKPPAAVAPRDAAAPPVAPGKNSTLADARPLALDVAEAGELLTIEDTRFYKVDNALKFRDLALVRLQNESATLRPYLKILNADKSLIAEPYDTSPGASVQRAVTLDPGQPLYVQVAPYGSTGKYKISVTPQKAYDTFEPNDDSLTPAAVRIGTDINAGILDDKDHDWYRVSGASKTSVKVTFENLSTTLRPDVKVYDGNKSMITEKYDGTPGANLSFTVDLKALGDFFIEVVPFGTSGKYRLRID